MAGESILDDLDAALRMLSQPLTDGDRGAGWSPELQSTWRDILLRAKAKLGDQVALKKHEVNFAYGLSSWALNKAIWRYA